MLSREAIENICARLQAGDVVEESKLEIKQAWPVLTEPDGQPNQRGRMEFLKDLTAMANTPGPTGYVVYGVAKDGTLHDAPFHSCGLRDASELHGLIAKGVTRPPQCEVRSLELVCSMNRITVSVLEVPPSVDKPHVIGLYETPSGQKIQNYVPVRHLTSVYPANRFDYEHMAYDRKNIEPDYALEVFLTAVPVRALVRDLARLDLHVPLAFLNYGRRPVAIMSSTLYAKEDVFGDSHSEITFDCYAYHPKLAGELSWRDICFLPLVVPANGVVVVSLEYRSLEAIDHVRVSRLQNDFCGSGNVEFRLSFEALGGYRHHTGGLRAPCT